jgi:hypothetical protein
MSDRRPNNNNAQKESACPRQFELVQAISGVTQPGKTQAILDHTQACPRCRGIVTQLKHDRHDFLNRHPTDIGSAQIIARAHQQKRSSRLALWLAPASAALAALLLVILLLESPQPGPGIRTKGEISLKFYIQQGDQAIPGKSGGIYHENDRIQFVYSSGANRYLFLVSIDDQGKVSNFNHEKKTSSVSIIPGANRVLAGSIILDDSIGPERIFAIFSNQPLRFDQIRQAARSAYTELRSHGKSVEDLTQLPLEFSQATLIIYKR